MAMNRDACLLIICVPTQIDIFTKFTLPNTYATHCTAITEFLLLASQVKFQQVIS